MTKKQNRTGAPKASLFVKTCCCGLLGLLCSACGSPDQGETPPPESAVQTPQAASSIAETMNPLAGMVKAVPTVAGEKSVELRFELPKKPILGEPFDLNLNVLVLADSSVLELKVTPHAGIELIAGDAASFGALKTGESVSHTLQLRASAAGISVIDVQLVTMLDGKPQAAAFAIPVALVTASEPAVATASK